MAVYLEEVALLAANMSTAGIAVSDIAYYFKMREEELLELYEYDIKCAKIDRIVKVSEVLYSSIIESGHPASVMFYLKNVADWENLSKLDDTSSAKDTQLRTVTVKIPTQKQIEKQLKDRNGE